MSRNGTCDVDCTPSTWFFFRLLCGAVAGKQPVAIFSLELTSQQTARRALRLFKKHFPGMCVTLHDLSAEDMQPLLLQKKLDVALTVLRHKLSPALGMQELARYETCVVVGATHPLAKAKSVSLEQVASEPVATFSRQDYPGYHKHLEKMFATISRQPRICNEYDSGSSLIAAVAAGQEFALPPSSVSTAAGARLIFLKLNPALPPWIIVALWRKEAETEPVRAFVAAASEPSRMQRDGSPWFNKQDRKPRAVSFSPPAQQ